ncbi:MAG: serine hydrolase [Clostridiales bacterium]|jgi:CubicO group peptidase (beta-lactamase class C family)|nr:serine hydrolase [Clostridiales bacterium]
MEDFNKFIQSQKQALEKAGQAGMAICAVKDGEVVIESCLGFRDVDRKLPPTPNTLFPIGSNTKAFTAAALMILADRGKVKLDAPIQDILPELVFADDSANTATPRDLLCHRTGLSRSDLLWIMRPYIVRKELPLIIKGLDQAFPFRSTYLYNNIMYACLGRLVEVADGRKWEQFVKEEIFEPLGMKTASFDIDSSVSSGDFSLAYEKSGQNGSLESVSFSRLHGMAPAGAINANIREISNWIRLHLQKGLFDGKQIISESGIRDLTNPQIPVNDNLVEGSEVKSLGYALGWSAACQRGEIVVSHGGNVNGSTSEIGFMPSRNAGIAIFVNSGSSVLPMAAMHSYFDLLLGASEKDWVMEAEKGLSALMEQAMPKAETPAQGNMSHDLEEYAGSYSHDAYGLISVKPSGDGLAIRFAERDLALTHTAFETFSFAWEGIPASVAFETGTSGKVEAALLSFMGSPIRFKK